MAQKEYLDAFNDELEAFKGRIRTRAKQKIDEAIKEHEEVSLHLLILTRVKSLLSNEHRRDKKPAFCICGNKDADQLHGNREADQRLCFRYIDSTITLLPKYEIPSF